MLIVIESLFAYTSKTLLYRSTITRIILNIHLKNSSISAIVLKIMFIPPYMAKNISNIYQHNILFNIYVINN